LGTPARSGTPRRSRRRRRPHRRGARSRTMKARVQRRARSRVYAARLTSTACVGGGSQATGADGPYSGAGARRRQRPDPWQGAAAHPHARRDPRAGPQAGTRTRRLLDRLPHSLTPRRARARCRRGQRPTPTTAAHCHVTSCGIYCASSRLCSRGDPSASTSCAPAAVRVPAHPGQSIHASGAGPSLSVAVLVLLLARGADWRACACRWAEVPVPRIPGLDGSPEPSAPPLASVAAAPAPVAPPPAYAPPVASAPPIAAAAPAAIPSAHAAAGRTALLYFPARRM
jgi:hypothetical protein